MKVSAKTKAKPTPVEVEYNVPEKLVDLTKAFGEEVITSAARSAIVIALQAAMRRLIEKGKTVVEIQTAVKTWKPDVRNVVGKSAFEKASASLAKLSPEEKAKLLAQLKAG